MLYREASFGNALIKDQDNNESKNGPVYSWTMMMLAQKDRISYTYTQSNYEGFMSFILGKTGHA